VRKEVSYGAGLTCKRFINFVFGGNYGKL